MLRRRSKEAAPAASGAAEPESRAERGLTVMIPLGGIGSRFQKEGYSKPKPFISVLGKPMILWVLNSLKLGPKDTLVVVYNPNWMSPKYWNAVHAKYPKLQLVAGFYNESLTSQLPAQRGTLIAFSLTLQKQRSEWHRKSLACAIKPERVHGFATDLYRCDVCGSREARVHRVIRPGRQIDRARTYATCTSCLIYPQCIWCSANASCRNPFLRRRRAFGA